MQKSRYIAYLDPELIKTARALGLENFSGFVELKLRDYINRKEKKNES